MATPVYATWNATTAYATGDVVTDLGLDYVATANNINAQPGFTILWTLLTPPGGVTTLSVSGDDVVANPGGSNADISTTTTVAATAVKTTQVSYDSGFLLTTVAGDFDIKSGITQRILLTTAGDITAFGTVEPATITDSVATQGAAGQVLTAGAGSELRWAADLQGIYNKILVDEVSPPAGGVVNLTWSTGDPPNVYVPYATFTTTTTVEPIDPAATGTGWRFAKTYLAESVSTAGTTLVSGNTYTIVAVGNPVLNWVAMGAPAATAGTQFLYNGVAPVGGTTTVGTAYASTKISWYALNALFGLGLPQSIVPSVAIKKKNLRNAWFLVKMNSDVALQGSFAIQIETYAYQFGGNTTNDYTGRWAYSLPLQQGQGFSANSTTNITTGAGLLTPRLRSGFTYLLYAGDISPSYLPSNGLTFISGGGNLFAPSQVSTENTLRDPYNLYVSTPHFGLTSSSYVANATQPAYGGANPYTDPGDVEVASIYLNTSSTSPPVGVGQQTMDFNVMAFGYSGLVESSGTEQTFSYTTQWV